MSLANRVTLIRVLLAPVIAILLVHGGPSQVLTAGILFVVAIITDLIDGTIARAMRDKSPIGGQLDGLADKLLWNMILFALVIEGIVPFWFAAIFFTRDVVYTEFKSMAAVRGVTVAVTSWPGKAKVALQNLGVTLAFVGLLAQQGESFPASWAEAALRLCLISFGLSFAVGMIHAGRDLVRHAGHVLSSEA